MIRRAKSNIIIAIRTNLELETARSERRSRRAIHETAGGSSAFLYDPAIHIAGTYCGNGIHSQNPSRREEYSSRRVCAHGHTECQKHRKPRSGFLELLSTCHWHKEERNVEVKSLSEDKGSL
jgi:hypothetical protein